VTIGGTAPQPSPDSASVDGGQSVAIDLLANDQAVEGVLDPATVTIVQQPVKGSVSVDPETGIATYTAAERSSGSDTFSYTVRNSVGIISAPTSVTITINDIVPKAASDTATVAGGQSVAIDVLANDQATKGGLDPATVTVVQQPTLGTISIDPVTGVVTYSAEAESEGTDAFTYSVANDQGIRSEAASVTVTVTRSDSVQSGLIVYMPIVRVDE
ncbi:MAG: Ig-like domain-containing protein, partial [Chloroflexota bacterium]